jgi:hypothetical protein
LKQLREKQDLCFYKTGFDFSENRTSSETKQDLVKCKTGLWHDENRTCVRTNQDLALTKTVFGENKNRTSPRANQYLQKNGRLIEVSHPVRSGLVIISLVDQGDGDTKSNAIGQALGIWL